MDSGKQKYLIFTTQKQNSKPTYFSTSSISSCEITSLNHEVGDDSKKKNYYQLREPKYLPMKFGSFVMKWNSRRFGFSFLSSQKKSSLFSSGNLKEISKIMVPTCAK
jgi:hypothetical protein